MTPSERIAANARPKPATKPGPEIPIDSDLDTDEMSSLLFPGSFPGSLAAGTPSSSTPRGAPGPSKQEIVVEVEKPDSLVTRVLVTPLLFTSFLLSFALVDRRNRLALASSQPALPTSPSVLTRARTFVFPRQAREPYAYLRAASTSIPKKAGKKGEEMWRMHAKQGKVFRAEMGDAFVLRTWVMTALIVAGALLLVGGAVVGWWVYRWYGVSKGADAGADRDGFWRMVVRGWRHLGL